MHGAPREQVQDDEHAVFTAGRERTELSLGESAETRRESLRRCNFVLERRAIKEDGSTKFFLFISSFLFEQECSFQRRERKASQHQTSSPELSETTMYMPDATSREGTQPRN